MKKTSKSGRHKTISVWDLEHLDFADEILSPDDYDHLTTRLQSALPNLAEGALGPGSSLLRYLMSH